LPSFRGTEKGEPLVLPLTDNQVRAYRGLQSLRKLLEELKQMGFREHQLEAVVREPLTADHGLEYYTKQYVREGDPIRFLEWEETSRGCWEPKSRRTQWGDLPTLTRVFVRSNLVSRADSDAKAFRELMADQETHHQLQELAQEREELSDAEWKAGDDEDISA
jgi:hypothetical protein